MILIIILVVVLLIVIWCISTVNGFKKKEIRVQEGLSGEVRISDNAKKLRKQHKNDSVEMENEVFNKRFLVTTGNAQDAYYVLTPHMMEYILAMAGKSGGKVYMAFLRNGKLNVAVQTGRDFFELGKSEANIDKLRQKFLGELKWFTDIINTLRVEETLYKKETKA